MQPFGIIDILINKLRFCTHCKQNFALTLINDRQFIIMKYLSHFKSYEKKGFGIMYIRGAHFKKKFRPIELADRYFVQVFMIPKI